MIKIQLKHNIVRDNNHGFREQPNHSQFGNATGKMQINNGSFKEIFFSGSVIAFVKPNL